MKFDEERCSFESSGVEFRVLFSLNWQFLNKVLRSFNKLCGLLISARTTRVCARVRVVSAEVYSCVVWMRVRSNASRAQHFGSSSGIAFGHWNVRAGAERGTYGYAEKKNLHSIYEGIWDPDSGDRLDSRNGSSFCDGGFCDSDRCEKNVRYNSSDRRNWLQCYVSGTRNFYNFEKELLS